MDFDGAILAHSRWKRRLKDAIDKKETIDAAQTAKDDQCDLGKWIHGEARKAYGGDPALAELKDEHARFHRTAAEVVGYINRGDKAKATEMISTTGEFSHCSGRVVTAITKLRNIPAKAG